MTVSGKINPVNQNLLKKIFLSTGKHPLLYTVIFILLFIFAGQALRFSRIELDIYDVYDPGFQSSVDLSDMKTFYNDRSQMLVAFGFQKKPTASDICKLLTWSKKIAHYDEVKNVTSLWSVRSPKVLDDKVWYPRTLSDPCVLDSKTSYEFLNTYSEKFFRHLISSDGSQNLVFDISFSGSDSDTKQVKYIIDETNSFISKELPEVDADYLGMAAFRYYFKKIMLQDSVYNLLILLIIFVVMRLIYGSWISGLYLCLTLVGSTLVLYGSLALLNIPIDILTNNLFLMTAVAGTADFIFVSQYQMQGEYEDSFLKIITPAFFTSLTTVVGFLSLNSSDLSIIQNFGNGAAIGAISEWFMMFIFLPSFLKLFRLNKSWVRPDRAMKLVWIDKIKDYSLPRFFVFVLSVLMLLAFPSFFFLNDQDSPLKNLPENHILREAYTKFEKNFNWQGQAFLYFPELPSDAVQKNVIESLKSHPLIVRIEDPEELATEWTLGLPKLRSDLIRRELSMTPLWERYYSSEGTLRIPLYLKEQDLHSLKKLRDEVQAVCEDRCRLAGQRVVYLEYGEKISKTMIESFAVSIILVTLVLVMLLWINGKIKYVMAVIMSSLMGPLIVLTLIALFQIPVTLVTSIFLAVMVGLAGDNAIHFLMASDKNLEEGIRERSRASIVVTLVMILGSSMFLLQSLLPMKILGILFILGFLVNMGGDLWGLKGLLTKKADQNS